MSTTSSSTRSFPDGAALASFIVSTLTITLIGCALISAALPFPKSAILSRRLETARSLADDPEKSARALAIVDRMLPILEPYDQHAVEGYRILARAHAARGNHEESAEAAMACYRRIGAPLCDTIQRANLPTRWGARLFHRITGAGNAGDPWLAYRDAKQTYQVLKDEKGMQHIHEHLNRNHGNAHPWYHPGPEAESETAAPDSEVYETDITRVETTAPPTNQPATPEHDDATAPQWALPLPSGAIAYNRRRERLREIPADTLIDVREHLVWDNEPMVESAVYVLNRWVSNIFLRTSQISIHDGCAGDISDREKRLHIQRLELYERIEKESQREPPPAPVTVRGSDDTTAPTIPRREARRQLRELEREIDGIQNKIERAQGPRRAELIDKMRRLGYQRFRLQQAAAGAVETLNGRVKTPPKPETPPEESPRLQRLRRQLADLETELQRLAESR